MKPVVLVTDLARAKILDLLNEEEAATPQGLRIEVTGESGPEYRYELSFDALDSAEADDSVVDWLGLGVIVPASSFFFAASSSRLSRRSRVWRTRMAAARF